MFYYKFIGFWGSENKEKKKYMKEREYYFK